MAVMRTEARDDDVTQARVVLPSKSHLYDVRAAKYLEFVRETKAIFKKRAVKLYAMIPYKVASLALDLPAEAKPGDLAPFVLRVVPAGKGSATTHFVRFEVRSPDGKQNRAYSRNLTAERGKAEGAIPLALNDAPGAWTVTARDIVSGLRVVRTMRVR